jgi:hypothetical protein
VVRGAADGERWSDKRVELLGDTVGELIAKHRVRGKRKVRPVLLGGAQRDDDRRPPGRKVIANLRP